MKAGDLKISKSRMYGVQVTSIPKHRRTDSGEGPEEHKHWKTELGVNDGVGAQGRS